MCKETFSRNGSKTCPHSPSLILTKTWCSSHKTKRPAFTVIVLHHGLDQALCRECEALLQSVAQLEVRARGEKLSWRGGSLVNTAEKSRETIVDQNPKSPDSPSNNAKNNLLTSNRILNTKMQAEWGPEFLHLTCQGWRSAPLSATPLSAVRYQSRSLVFVCGRPHLWPWGDWCRVYAGCNLKDENQGVMNFHAPRSGTVGRLSTVSVDRKRQQLILQSCDVLSLWSSFSFFKTWFVNCVLRKEKASWVFQSISRFSAMNKKYFEKPVVLKDCFQPKRLKSPW